MRHTSYYCRHCGWHSEPEAIQGARVNKCDTCRKWGLLYVAFDPETETAEAERILIANQRAVHASGVRVG